MTAFERRATVTALQETLAVQLCVKQRDAGDLKIARETFQHAERLRDEITALEEMVKPEQRALGGG